MAFYRFKNGHTSFSPNIQMNVTSLVDVTLVTLIIYILISPSLEHGIDVQLPQATPYQMATSDPVVVSMSKKGQFFFNNTLISREELDGNLSGIAASNPETAVVIRADAGIPYGDIIEVLDQVRESGLTNIGLVTRNKRN